MKLKILPLTGLFCLLLIAACEKKQTIEEEIIKSADILTNGMYKIDLTLTKVKWTGKKITESHYGYIDVKKGVINIQQGVISEGSFSLDANSISDEDLKGNEKYRNKLNNHLKSADFFDAVNYPLINFTIDSVTRDNDSTNAYTVKGQLEIKGITNGISFPATLLTAKDTLNITAKFSFDRTLFDIKFHSGIEKWGDKVINDDIDVEVKLVAIKVSGEAKESDNKIEIEVEEEKSK